MKNIRKKFTRILVAPILFSPTYQDEGNNRKDKRKGVRVKGFNKLNVLSQVDNNKN